MTNAAGNHGIPTIKNNGVKKEKGEIGGNAIGCLVIILLFIGFGIFSVYMSTPQIGGDKDKVVDDIYRYHRNFGNWPQSLNELKSKLPDFQFKYSYYYYHDDEMFVVAYEGSGMIGDDYGEFYRSDTKNWKEIYLNRKELNDLTHLGNNKHLTVKDDT